MDKPRFRPIALPLALVAAVAVFVPAPAGALAEPCPPADPILEGRPSDLPDPGLVLPVRQEPDGATTVTISVEDPADAPSAYSYTAVSDVHGIWSHRWPISRHIVTYGVYVVRDSTRIRVPVFLVENAVSQDLATAAAAAALAEATPFLNNSLTVALNTLMPTPVAIAQILMSAGGLLPPPAGVVLGPAGQTVGRAWLAGGNGYPFDDDFENRPPVYVWTTFRSAAGSDVWHGAVLMHQGSFETTQAGTVTTREGCRRTRLGTVVRNGAATQYLGGVFVDDRVASTTDSATKAFTGSQQITTGASAGGVDVPLTTLKQSETKEGQWTYPGYAAYQKDEITLGVGDGSGFVPLIGSRAETTNGSAPNGQHHLVSFGVYDASGTYRPAAGYRWHVERTTLDLWPLEWALTGGPGSTYAGDWEADVGVFDPAGTFVPVAGATYDDAFEGAIYPHQMMITAGGWTAGTYNPAIGATYDAEVPFVYWTLGSVANVPSLMGRWIVSAGTFSPLGGYVPVAGATFAPGAPQPGEPVVEEYRVGVFPAEYSSGGTSSFVPVAGANWYSTMTSGSWAFYAGTRQGKAAADARVDIGPVVAGTFTPVVGLRATAGAPDRYGVGVYAVTGFVTLLEACHTTNGSGDHRVGVAAGGGSSRVPVAYAGAAGGQPSAGAGDCPG